MAFHLGHRSRLVLRYAGIGVFGILCFVFALQMSFPYSRVKQKITDALADKYDVQIGEVKRGILPGVFYLESVTLKTRPTKPDDVPTTFFIKEVEVNVHILSSLLKWGAVADVDLKLPPGHVLISAAISKSEIKLGVDGEDVPSALLPMREAIGLPMSGKVTFDADFDLPITTNKAGKTGPDWSQAEGEFNFACATGCTVGPGKLKTKMKNARTAAFAADGIDVGKINIDSLVAKLEIKGGKADVTRFETKSGDGELHVDFSMKLEPVLDDSTVTGCLRYKGSDALAKRDNKTFSSIQLIGGPLGPDGLYHIKLADKFREIKRLPQTCGPGAAPETPTEVPSRPPNLTVHPDEPPKPPPPVTPPTVPPVPPPTTGVTNLGSASAGSGSATFATTPNAVVPPPAPPVPENGSAAGSAGSDQGSAQQPQLQ